jgi:hypothetical protein
MRYLIGTFGIAATLLLTGCQTDDSHPGSDSDGSAAASARPGEGVGDAGPAGLRGTGMQTSPDTSATVPPSNPNAPQASPIGSRDNAPSTRR